VNLNAEPDDGVADYNSPDWSYPYAVVTPPTTVDATAPAASYRLTSLLVET
jgi:hypothetical protein